MQKNPKYYSAIMASGRPRIGAPPLPSATAGIMNTKRSIPANVRRIRGSARTETSRGLTARASGVPAPASIAELARALKHNVDLIFEWVYSNVDFYPLWGAHKGPLGTLLDRTGGAFEQSALMIALLRESGYRADFVYGTIRLTRAQVEQLLGTEDSTGITPTQALLVSSQIPFEPNPLDDDFTYVDLSHVWVTVEISGTDYVFDPTYKTYGYIEGIDVESAMDWDPDPVDGSLPQLIDTAGTGADLTHLPTYLTGFNTDGVGDAVRGYATTLLNTIRADHFAATMEEIIGGRLIEPLTDLPVRQAVLAYQAPGSTTTEWTSIPDEFRATFAITFSTISVTLFADEIYGKRLTISYNESQEPELRLDGEVIATGEVLESNVQYQIDFEIIHPFADDFADQSWSQSIYGNGTYVMSNIWGICDQSMVDYHRLLLQQNIASGGDPGDEDVLGESLCVNLFMRCAQTNQVEGSYDQLASAQHFWYHLAGIIGYNALQQAPYFDLQATAYEVSSRVGDTSIEPKVFAISALLGSAFEAGIIQQNYGVTGINASRMLNVANAASQKIFDTTSANWTSGANVKSQLTNWGDKSFQELQIDAGSRLVIHEDGLTTVDDFIGGGWHQISSGGFGSWLNGAIGAPPPEVLTLTEDYAEFKIYQHAYTGVDIHCNPSVTEGLTLSAWGTCLPSNPVTLYNDSWNVECGLQQEQIYLPGGASIAYNMAWSWWNAPKAPGGCVVVKPSRQGTSTGTAIPEAEIRKGAADSPPPSELPPPPPPPPTPTPTQFPTGAFAGGSSFLAVSKSCHC